MLPAEQTDGFDSGEARQIEFPAIFLVEGMDDVGFWKAFFLTHGRNDVQVLQTQGKDNLRVQLLALRNTRGFDQVRWLGIAQDADDNPLAAFRRICSALERAALPLPTQPWMTTATSPSIAALVLPDGSQTGDLEDLV